jgi:amino-acid N-acetyltransferase
MDNIQYRFATKEDLYQLKELLESCLLPFEDIDSHIDSFIIAIVDNKIIGSLGVENYGKDALLRSFAVSYNFRNSIVSKILMGKMSQYAIDNDIQRAFLLTTTIDQFLLKIGFSKIDRQLVPKIISQTKEFASICPSSAICMMKNIKN